MARILLTQWPDLNTILGEEWTAFTDALAEQHNVVYISDSANGKQEPPVLPFSLGNRLCSVEQDELLAELGDDVEKWLERLTTYPIQITRRKAELELINQLGSADLLLRAFRPDVVLVWNPYILKTGILHDLAVRRGLSCGYIEWGLLPKSVSLEMEGFLGRSRLLNLTTSELNASYSAPDWHALGAERLQRIRHFGSPILYGDGQGMRSASALSDHGEQGVHRVLVLMSSDSQCGLIPTSHGDRICNFPLFENSWQLVSELAKRSNFEVIVKCHPHGGTTPPEQLPPNVKVVDGNPNDLIASSDVVIAWGTKLELNVVSWRKPLVLPGFGLLQNKGCAYEVSQADDLINIVDEAIAKGLTETMHKNFCIYLGYLVDQKLMIFDVLSPSKHLDVFNRLLELDNSSSSKKRDIALDWTIALVCLERRTSSELQKIAQDPSTFSGRQLFRALLNKLLKLIKSRSSHPLGDT